MPRFFFDIVGDDGETTDDVGQDFPDLTTAFDAAMCVLSEVAKDAKLIRYSMQYSCTVKNSAGSKLFRSTMSIFGEPLMQDYETNHDQRLAHEGGNS